MKNKKRTNRRNLINKKVLFTKAKQSNLVRHAIKELKLAGYDKDACGPNKWMYDQVIELLTVFASHGHSGHSAPYAINLFIKLANWETISPLTFADNEWVEISTNVWQNKRKSSFFKDIDGSIHNVDAYTKKPTMYWDKDKQMWATNENAICWQGSWLFEIENDICTGRAFNKCNLYIFDATKEKYIPKDKEIIPCKEVEIDKDNYMMFVDKDSTALLFLSCNYSIEWRMANHIVGKLCYELTPEDEIIAIKELKKNIL